MKNFDNQYSSNLNSFLLLINLWKHINRKRRTQILFLMLIMFFTGILEVISLGSVIPFLTVISNPESISENLICKNILFKILFR